MFVCGVVTSPMEVMFLLEFVCLSVYSQNSIINNVINILVVFWIPFGSRKIKKYLEVFLNHCKIGLFSTLQSQQRTVSVVQLIAGLAVNWWFKPTWGQGFVFARQEGSHVFLVQESIDVDKLMVGMVIFGVKSNIQKILCVNHSMGYEKSCLAEVCALLVLTLFVKKK